VPVPVEPPVGVAEGLVEDPGVMVVLGAVGAIVEPGVPRLLPGVERLLPGVERLVLGETTPVDGFVAPPVERLEGRVPDGVGTEVPYEGESVP